MKEFLDAVDEINTTVAKQLAPLLKQIDAAGAAVPKESPISWRSRRSDPLSLTADEIERRIDRDSGDSLRSQANWPDAVATTGLSLDALRDAVTTSGADARARNAQGADRPATGLPPTPSRSCAQSWTR